MKNVRIVSNSGDLVNENSVDVKCDYDPTHSSSLNIATDVTYKQIFYETAQFIASNNTKKQRLQYPAMYLNCNPPKCQDTKHCKQCINKMSLFGLCLTKRREMGNKLFDTGQLRDCMSDSLERTSRQLVSSDKMLIKANNEYKLHENWFAKVYSFLKWQQEVVDVVLHNLVELGQVDSQTQGELHLQLNHNDNYTDDNSVIHDEKKDTECDTAVLTTVSDHDKFDLVTLLHSYLAELSDYLVLYYCCFDSQKWISVFYPFIEAAIGTSQCTMLFAQLTQSPSKPGTASHSSLCNKALEVAEGDVNIVYIKAMISTEMKGISIFKRLLFDIYQGDNYDFSDNDVVQNVNIMFNPFSLCINIGVKLNESVNNIKTQIMINEIREQDGQPVVSGEPGGHGASMIMENRLDKSLKEEEKDDWAEDKNGDYGNYSLKVPSFIRLFSIRRILFKYIFVNYNTFPNSKKNQSVPQIIEDLVNVFDNNQEVKTCANLIITRLIYDGIKIYMKKWYNEGKQANIIEDIFNNIILVKFEKQYNKLNTVYAINDSNTNGRYYQNQVFISNDLMSSIFQYLYWQNLIDCNFVNSYWLYHAWNVNSVYRVCLDKMIQDTLEYGDNKNNTVGRLWQRLINAKYIKIENLNFSSRSDNTLRLLVNRLSLLTNIESVSISRFKENDTNVTILKSLMSRSKERIKYCNINTRTVTSGKSNLGQLSPLRLPQARSVVIHDSYFYRSWSNKCTKIEWKNFNITKDCCEFWIKNCDCSNVRFLELCSVTFAFGNDDDDESALLKQLASKFINLQRLKIGFDGDFDKNTMLFWQLLKGIKVELNVGFRKKHWYESLNDVMKKPDLKIEKLNVDYNPISVQFIQQRDNCGLKYLNAFGKIQELASQLSFKSITCFELSSSSLSDTNDFLGLNVIIDNQLFIIVDNHYDFDKKYDFELERTFKKLCQNIRNLFDKQIAIDIRIIFTQAKQANFESCFEIYELYFQSKRFMDNDVYQKPLSKSKLCVPRVKPYVYFVGGSERFAFRATNCNVKME